MHNTVIKWKTADEEPPPLPHIEGGVFPSRRSDPLIWTDGQLIRHGYVRVREDGKMSWYEGWAGAGLVSVSERVFWAPRPDLSK